MPSKSAVMPSYLSWRMLMGHACADVSLSKLKVKVGDYNNLKGQMTAVARKAGGSLAVRDINTLIKSNQVIDSENMT